MRIATGFLAGFFAAACLPAPAVGEAAPWQLAQQSGGENEPAKKPGEPNAGEESEAAAGPQESIAKPPPAAESAENPPEILRDLSQLPFAARKMHELLVAAARGGDIEALRPYIGAGDDMTMLSFGEEVGDPIEFLKSQSGDGEGHEILAILLEVLETGFVHLEAGSENEMYVWPYFFAVPAEKLGPAEKVELFTLLTSGDFEEMKSFGQYIFYRAGITPQGRFRFFVAGD
jgi:hypothetical protein